MKPAYKNGNVISRCPDCGGAVTTFEYKHSTGEHGTIIINVRHKYGGADFSRVIYKLLKCSGCSRGGLAKIHDNGQVAGGILESFSPMAIDEAKVPDCVPTGIVAEYREAEVCASVGAWRAASGLLRSTLEKTLKENGYIKGTLASRIDDASNEGIITESRRKKAHSDIRVLGNDVLHDEWREVTSEEVESAHHYVQRILEDFYDDRPSVEDVLLSKNRLKKE